MNGITVYYYTAWNGYSWQGCDAAKSADLQRYMEAAGVLPGDPGRKPPFGGAIACQIAGSMGVAVYRCGIRPKGDAFGRDSVFIALAFIPLERGPVDFAALLAMPQMLPSGRGELAPAEIPLQGLSMPAELRQKAWREESFTERLAGAPALREASAMFFGRSCQLGLLQASFASETDEVRDVVTTLSYRAFPEVLALADASRKYYEAKRNAVGPMSVDNPARVALWNAIYELRTKRVEKMPGYAGLAEYAAAKDAELNSGVAMSSTSAARTVAHSQQKPARPAPAQAGRAKNGGSAAPRGSLLPHVLMTIIVLLSGAFAACIIVFSRDHKNEVARLSARIEGLEQQCRTGRSEMSGSEIMREKLERDIKEAEGNLDRERNAKAGLELKVEELKTSVKASETRARKLEVELLNATNKLAVANAYNGVLWKRLEVAEGLLMNVRLKAWDLLELIGTEEDKETIGKAEATFANSKKALAKENIVDQSYLDSYRNVVGAYVDVLDKAVKEVEELKKLRQEQKEKASREKQQGDKQPSTGKQPTGKQQEAAKQPSTGKQQTTGKQQSTVKPEGAGDMQPPKQEGQTDTGKQEAAQPDFVLPPEMKFCEGCGLDLKNHRNSRTCPKCGMSLVPTDTEPADVKKTAPSGGKSRK